MARRLNITLSDGDYETLVRYSALKNAPPTKMAGDIMRELMPTFKAVIEAVTEAKSNELQAKATLQGALLDGIAQAVSISKMMK